jgi:hypothetical protein
VCEFLDPGLINEKNSLATAPVVSQAQEKLVQDCKGVIYGVVTIIIFLLISPG